MSAAADRDDPPKPAKPGESIGHARTLPLGLPNISRNETSSVSADSISVELERLGLSKSDVGKFEPTIEEAPQFRVDPLIGMVIADRYRIVDAIGRGGMGIVYKVEHVRIGKLLAMKLLAGELSRNHDVVRRFKTEALTASKLSSPNTVQVFDYGAADGLTYLVMELVSGDDLGRVLKLSGSLPPSRIGRIAVQIASSLAEAHAAGIVHRDIKPENVMILRARDGSDLAKVLDFGLAKIREGSELSELTSQGAIVGTPYFMSPEQIRGEQVDARSDIYSLGALLYRALTGVHPFNGPSPMSVFAKHLTEAPVPPIDLAPTISPGFSEIVLRALKKEPADRFQRIEDLQAAVVAELADLGSSGIETLLDSGALRRLEKPVQAEFAKDAVATRDELAAYERKLRRTRIGVSMVIGLFPLAGIVAGAHFLLKERPVVFKGVETESNDVVGSANELPYGQSISATLGKRRSPTESDIDFFQIEVPPGNETSSLTMTALPNIPLCVQVFGKGQTSPTAQYCPGRPGVDLDIPALRLPPGGYVLAVMQDLDSYGESRPPFIHENISDQYAIRLGQAGTDPAIETEPNDEISTAQPLKSGETFRAALGWAKDVDVYCPKVDSSGAFRFRVDDDARETGVVLSVALAQSGITSAPVRIHARSDQDPPKPAPSKGPLTDALAPFATTSFNGLSPSCLVVTLAVDPSVTKRSADVVPRGSKALYRISLEPIP